MADAAPQPKRRPSKRVAFSNHVGESLAAMRRTFELGIELYEPPAKPGDHGAGTPLPQDW